MIRDFRISFYGNKALEGGKRSMDEMKIGSKFTRTILSKLIKMLLKKKIGYDIDVQLNEFTATIIDGKAQVHINADAELEKDELIKMLKSAGLN